MEDSKTTIGEVAAAAIVKPKAAPARKPVAIDKGKTWSETDTKVA